MINYNPKGAIVVLSAPLNVSGSGFNFKCMV